MNKQNKTPLYLRLMEDLLDKIEGDTYKEGDKLPSERELCDIYDLSRITVRNALQELERDNYIYKVHGKGTFVAPKTYKQKLVKLYSFTEEMKKKDKEPQTKVISFKIITVEKRYADKLGVNPSDEVYEIKRLRLADNEPLMYETSYIPKERFPNLKKKDLEERPMYTVFLKEYDTSVTEAVEQFSATSLRQEEADHLNSEYDSPAMLIKRYAYNNGEIIEYTVSVTCGGKFTYTVELS